MNILNIVVVHKSKNGLVNGLQKNTYQHIWPSYEQVMNMESKSYEQVVNITRLQITNIH